MTLSEMAVLAMDEILLRTEISGRGEEGLGVGRPNGPGAGAAATSAALPCGAARFHFGIVPTQFILHLYTVILQPLDSIPTDGVHRQMVFLQQKS